MAWYKPWTWGTYKTEVLQKQTTNPDARGLDKSVVVPVGRASRPTFNHDSFVDIKGQVTYVNPGYIAEIIPIIRKLSWINPDLGLAVNDMVQLTNTGHRIKFDPGVPPEQQENMRVHLDEQERKWGDGVAGINGVINKMIAQIWISGALSIEWVVENDLKSIKHIAFVNPETIRFRWDKKKLRFFPYQRQDYNTGMIQGEKYVKLNKNTYKYYGLNGDTDIPYGIPPFLTALNSLSTQAEMDKNIKFILKQLGLLGFVELLMGKPGPREGESDSEYETRLKRILSEAKTNILEGVSDGVVTGYEEDHTFEFHSTTKNLNGVPQMYNLNEVQVANGLKMAPDFLGVQRGRAESGLNITFTKMLSQLQNIQKMIAFCLQWGYALELRLAGFKFEHLDVVFNPSTITDELKYQQSQEYKIRNVANKYNMGIIGQHQAADELGYDKPDQKEPRAPLDDSGAAKEKRQDQNDKSDKKTRDKSKPQPKRGDSKNILNKYMYLQS